MDCPACNVPLDRTEYEEAAVFQCPQCAGYLVQQRRLVLIKSSREHTPKMLKKEAASRQHPESDKRIRCPQCETNYMQKERKRFGDDGEFQVDVCKDCDQVWFDGGELARYQMSFESSPKGQDAERMHRRKRMRTPEQQAELDARMNALPRSGSSLAEGFKEGLLLPVLVVMPLLVIGVWLLEYPLISGILSVLLAVLFGWQLMRALDTTPSPGISSLNQSQIAALIILAVVEIAYLCLLTFWH